MLSLSFTQALLLQGLSGFGLGSSQKNPQEVKEGKGTQGIGVSIGKDAACWRIRGGGIRGCNVICLKSSPHVTLIS
jgi:hypothetical protein